MSFDHSADRYISEINNHPLLSREEELEMARKAQAGDKVAEDRLVAANLRFVVKVAHEYRGYGLKLLDLIQEGNIGLVLAVRKFDITRGYKLISYAVWWIRAYIQNYIMRSWSLIKIGTTAAQRKLFFRLRAERDKADRLLDDGTKADTMDLATALGVQEADIVSMEMRLCARDASLSIAIDSRGLLSFVDMLVDPAVSNETVAVAKNSDGKVRDVLHSMLPSLDDRERFIVEHRWMAEDKMTLRAIGEHFGTSRERVRQIERRLARRMRARFAIDGIVEG